MQENEIKSNSVARPHLDAQSAAKRAERSAVSRVVLATILMLLPASTALAQDEGEKKEEEKKLPLQKGPFVKPRGLQIPGKLPELRKGAPPNTVGPRGLEGLKTGQPTPQTGDEPVKLSAPPPEEEDSGPSFADLKKAGKGKKCKPMAPTDKVTFDFKGDIQELVETISKTTCKNFIITNKVRSQKFEILSPSPITVAEAWRAFLSALEANDFTVIQVGRYYKIIQATDGTRAPVPMYEDGREIPVDDRMITKIWRLKHGGDPNMVVNYLNIFKSNKGQVHPYLPTGTIIATDFGTSIERMERVLKEIDQPGGVERVHIVPIQFASAMEIADKLTQVFEPSKGATGGPKPSSSRLKVQRSQPPNAEGQPPPAAGGEEDDAGAVQVSKILADDRTNKLIIISSERAFKQILALLKELDVPEGDVGQIHVLRLKHADAEELASTLSALSQGKPTSPRPAAPAGPQGAPKPPPAAPAGPTSAALFQGDVKITADKATNSLVITASKADLASVKRVVEELDVARFQVFVEAMILEVAIKRDRQLGTGWHGGFAPEIDGQQAPIVFGNTPNQELSSLANSINPLGLASLLGFAGIFRGPTIPGTDQGPFAVSGGIPAIGVVVQALQSSNDVNLVSSPHLLTMDNEEAEIQVNEKRPFPSGLSLGGLGGIASQLGASGGAAGALGNLGGLGLGSVSFNREDIGLTLKLKPQINDDEYVRLEIDQELSDVAGVDQVTGQTITSKRSAKTVVEVRSQDSVVIGGLVRDRETINESKTPLLGDLPLIGWLFKRQQKTVEKVNLILILTPYIIRGPDDFRVIFERKMAERKDFVDRYYGYIDEQYRPQIDWDRKLGPLATYRLSMRKELIKVENDGPGLPDEKVITPKTLDLDVDVEEEGAEPPAGDTPEVPESPSEPPPIDEEDL
jgi:general secretion pathway protein D